MSEVFRKWQAAIVAPCLRVNVNSIPVELHKIVAAFTTALHSGSLPEEHKIPLKVAASAVTGQLAGHPLLLGLALQCRRMLEKQGRGVQGMRGRRSAETEREAFLIQDAGIQLSLACANTSLAVSFGLPESSGKVNLQMLTNYGLPSPGLGMLWPDQRMPRAHLSPKRSLD